MSLGNDQSPPTPPTPPAPPRGTDPTPATHDGVPPTDRRLLVIAGVLLAIPVIALMAVPTYAHESPHLWGFPFFYWYQFLWVFICSGCTYAAYRLTLAARRRGDAARRGQGGPR